MVMESPQTVDVDRTVIDPDTLQQVGRSGRSLAAKRALVDQIEYVAHSLKVPSELRDYAVRSYCSDEITCSATESANTGHGQPVVTVSEKSLRAPERSRRTSSFELGRPG